MNPAMGDFTDMANEDAHGRCAVHDVVMERCEERHNAQALVNKEAFAKIDKINDKINLILGAVAVGWPLFQLIIHLLKTEGVIK